MVVRTIHRSCSSCCFISSSESSRGEHREVRLVLAEPGSTGTLHLPALFPLNQVKCSHLHSGVSCSGSKSGGEEVTWFMLERDEGSEAQALKRQQRVRHALKRGRPIWLARKERCNGDSTCMLSVWRTVHHDSQVGGGDKR